MNRKETKTLFLKALSTTKIEEFISLIFPQEWEPIGARIIETGAEMAEGKVPWAARWSYIPLTKRYSKGRLEDDNGKLETAVKSCIFRAHDCLHQLWGLPVPSREFNSSDFYLFKRANMCGEVAVLMLTEFVLGQRLSEMHPSLSNFLWSRNALPMLHGPLAKRSWEEIACRLDGVLHKKLRPHWLRTHPASSAFADDYVPMLEEDRQVTDYRWELMKRENWIPEGAPNSRYGPDLDGLELTRWMIADFFHLMDTDGKVDRELTKFNRERRSKINFPRDWK